MRIFTDGAEMIDMAFWDDSNVATSQNTDPIPLYSAYCYRITGGVTTRPLLKYLPGTYSEFYCRGRFWIDQLQEFFFWDFGSAGTYLTENLRVNSTSGKLEARSFTTSLASSSRSFPIEAWALVEAYIKIADAPNGRFVVYMDGVKEIDFTGDTKIAAATTIDAMKIYPSVTGRYMGVDDLAMNDTDNSDGKNDISWCGDGVVVKIIPSGSGTNNNFLNSGSTSGSSNYTYVDEYPNDGDTTYVYASGSSSGFKDQYKMSSFSGQNKIITRIYAETRAKKSIADVTSLKIGYLPSGGTNQISGSLAVTTSYSRFVGNEAIVNPVTSASWTEADVNALEYVSEI